MTAQPIEGVGIEALNVYCGVAAIPVRALFEGRGLDLGRLPNLAMRERAIALPCEDPVTNAVNAARPLLAALGPEVLATIEILIVASESGIDLSKSIASYVHEHLGLSRQCRTVEMKQACYSAVAALQLAASYVASGVSPGARVLVIAADVSLVDARAEYAEPAMGTGAAALLVSDRPRVLRLDLGAFGLCSFETMDSARPTPQLDVADVDGSLFAYLDCLSASFADYCRRVEGADFVSTFDFLAFHTPFAGLVKAAHRKMMRELSGASPEAVAADFAGRVEPSLVYPSVVGNLCAGSVFLALASLIETARPERAARVGLFSYGSGCASEFLSGVVGPEAVAALAPLAIGERLAGRVALSFADYGELLAANLCCLVPERERRVELGPSLELLERLGERPELLVLTEIRDFHRKYRWA
ncbi:MAG TPA: hydroxymethylglutaryl-CoA synthase [Thermoanaerobaculia bacterium]|nr:hydroxymethylglutaryl-CoA synthase [Thermoanaerobaculia bacterium]